MFIYVGHFYQYIPPVNKVTAFAEISQNKRDELLRCMLFSTISPTSSTVECVYETYIHLGVLILASMPNLVHFKMEN